MSHLLGEFMMSGVFGCRVGCAPGNMIVYLYLIRPPSIHRIDTYLIALLGRTTAGGGGSLWKSSPMEQNPPPFLVFADPILAYLPPRWKMRPRLLVS
ncbi:hypothetical protein Q1695_010901 [Nippostrongylus brasiliensis]|nr:hypothetical protein Q1695_010901 [Nippostrongylus brasiliensis]